MILLLRSDILVKTPDVHVSMLHCIACQQSVTVLPRCQSREGLRIGFGRFFLVIESLTLLAALKFTLYICNWTENIICENDYQAFTILDSPLLQTPPTHLIGGQNGEILVVWK